MRPSNRSARACATPERSEPAIGWAATNFDRAAASASAASTIARFVLPASVIEGAVGRERARRGSTSAAIRSTGVQTTTTSAPAAASSGSVVAVVDRAEPPRLVEPAGVATDPDDPTRRPPAQSASPIDPPIRPTPTMATVPNRSNVRAPSEPISASHPDGPV